MLYTEPLLTFAGFYEMKGETPKSFLQQEVTKDNKDAAKVHQHEF